MKKLVIIGGGFAGSYIAKALENKFETTLIDTKDYFEFTPSILKTLINPDYIGKIQIMHKRYLKKTKIIIDKVREITKNEVILKNNKLPFDYLAICSGSSYNFPIKENVIHATRAIHLKESHEKLVKSKKVLIIGGGLVGVELASEISSSFPDKIITLVHSGSKLIPRNNLKSIDYSTNFLKNHNVNLILNEKIIKNEKNNYITDKNTKIEADIAFLCTGIKPNSNFMTKKFSKNIDDKGFIIVNSTLQLKNHKNIFAVGDVNNIKIEKTAQNTEEQARIAVKNIISLENKEKLLGYKPKTLPLVISLGKYNGIFEWKNLMLSGFIPAIIKNLVEKLEMLKLKR